MMLRGRGARPVGLLVLFWAVACSSGPTSVSANNYPRTCDTVADCFPVFEGEVGCCGGGCPNTAIRQDAVARFATDTETARKNSCNGVQPPCVAPPVCTMGRVTCEGGLCGLVFPDDGPASK
jgi:hypothetical protein